MHKHLLVFVLVLALVLRNCGCHGMTRSQRRTLAAQVQEMFQHGYDSYMKYAFPADELMPLSCAGRVRGVTKSRGDIDDALGRFSLTLVDSLDTLAVLGNLTEFYRAVQLTIEHVSFDRDIVVSTFETNIRMLGGLLGAHAVMLDLKKRTSPTRHAYLDIYNDELLDLARDLGERLLAAFDTKTGLPYSRVNLRHGIDALVRSNDATCTACAGTMILEFAALSRFTGDSSFENAARRALEFLWQSRHGTTHLVGTTINITSGMWLRQESGVGAGIDSYYEYLLKAFILLGDKTYLDIFHTHYESILKYLRRGPFLVDVHQADPKSMTRRFMDALQSFFPGLQVLYGDIPDAIEIHRMYYDILLQHKFMPESFMPNHDVVWANSPLRPEFAESTYMLYKATGDPIYLEIGKFIVDNYQMYARVRCGFASFQDVRSLRHEDQMDSFVLAETFKYLYLLFADEEDIPLDMDDYVFTTEAHLVPLNLAAVDIELVPFQSHRHVVQRNNSGVCHAQHEKVINYYRLFNVHYGHHQPMCRRYHNAQTTHTQRSNLAARARRSRPPPVQPENLDINNKNHLAYLDFLGIIVEPINQAVQLVYHPSRGNDAAEAQSFLQRLMGLVSERKESTAAKSRDVFTISATSGDRVFVSSIAGPALFGPDIKLNNINIYGSAESPVPMHACQPLLASVSVSGKIAVVQRGECSFIEKVKHCQDAGALAVVIYNHDPHDMAVLSMTADDDALKAKISIPSGFVEHATGMTIRKALEKGQVHIELSV
eukprot:m.61987 g.61987  ORF g.61987 m.61987 type:complete len:771 (-) comp13370_c0_seq3:153-2465(-)